MHVFLLKCIFDLEQVGGYLGQGRVVAILLVRGFPGVSWVAPGHPGASRGFLGYPVASQCFLWSSGPSVYNGFPRVSGGFSGGNNSCPGLPGGFSLFPVASGGLPRLAREGAEPTLKSQTRNRRTTQPQSNVGLPGFPKLETREGAEPTLKA